MFPDAKVNIIWKLASTLLLKKITMQGFLLSATQHHTLLRTHSEQNKTHLQKDNYEHDDYCKEGLNCRFQTTGCCILLSVFLSAALP